MTFYAAVSFYFCYSLLIFAFINAAEGGFFGHDLKYQNKLAAKLRLKTFFLIIDHLLRGSQVHNERRSKHCGAR